MITKIFEDGIRKVEVLNDAVIKYTLNRHDRSEYLTYDDVLFEILTNKSVSPDLWDWRGRIKYHGAGCYLYDLACARYYGFVDSLETLDDGLAKYFDYKDINNYQVDHANNNRRVNTRENLSLLPQSINSRKQDIVTKFRGLDNMYIAYCGDGEYRIELASVLPFTCLTAVVSAMHIPSLEQAIQEIQNADGCGCFWYGGPIQRYICKSPEAMLDCLKSLKYIRYPGMPEKTSLYTRYKDNKDVEYWGQDCERTIEIQRELVNANRDLFPVWEYQE